MTAEIPRNVLPRAAGAKTMGGKSMSEKYAKILQEQHTVLRTATELMKIARELIEISDDLSAVACKMANNNPAA